MRSILTMLSLAVALGGPLGCDYYAKPHRGLPESFTVNTLDGRTLGAESFRGKPWIFNIWLPG